MRESAARYAPFGAWPRHPAPQDGHDEDVPRVPRLAEARRHPARPAARGALGRDHRRIRAPASRWRDGSSTTPGGSSSCRGSSRSTWRSRSPTSSPGGRSGSASSSLHASLLLIFAGSAVTYFFKIEGSLFLWEGETGFQIVERDRENRVVSTHDLPFSVTLQDFVLETYPGTMRPSGFKSIVKVTDRTPGTLYDAQIWMNNPLEHRGYTLFQSSYQQDRGREATVLSVAKDPGQNIVFAGLHHPGAGHDRRALHPHRAVPRAGRARGARRRLRRRQGRGRRCSSPPCRGTALAATPADTLRRLPVQHDGRSMPLDTLAREAVWNVTGAYSWHGRGPGGHRHRLDRRPGGRRQRPHREGGERRPGPGDRAARRHHPRLLPPDRPERSGPSSSWSRPASRSSRGARGPGSSRTPRSSSRAS